MTNDKYSFPFVSSINPQNKSGPQKREPLKTSTRHIAYMSANSWASVNSAFRNSYLPRPRLPSGFIASTTK